MPTKAPHYPKRITVRMLQYRNACPDQVELFKATFPTGLEVNRSNILRAGEVGLDLVVAANFFLSDRNLDRWDEYSLEPKDAYDASLRMIRKTDANNTNEAYFAYLQAKPANLDNESLEQLRQNRDQLLERSRIARNRAVDIADIAYRQALAQLLADFLQLP